MRDLKALLGLLCIETRTDRAEWPRLVRNVQMAINHRPSKSLDGEAPVKVHTGMDAHNALDFYAKKDKFVNIKWTIKMVEYLETLQKTLDLVHQRVYEATAKVTIQARTKALGPFQFEIGDYVLYCSVDRQSYLGKLYFQWTGPYQIIDMKSPYVFHIQDLVQKKIIIAHVDPLSFFSTKQMEVTGELKDLISREGLVYDIEEFLDVVWDPDLKTYVVKTKWVGFTEEEATFEPFKQLLDQVPTFLLSFLNDLFKQDPEKVKCVFAHERDAILKYTKRKDACIYDFVT